VQLAGAQLLEREIGIGERERLNGGVERDFSRELEELRAVAPSQIRNRANRALSPKQRVRERRYVAHVDAAADERAAFAQRFERGRYQRPDRGENDCGIEQFRGRLIAAARPSCAQRQSELLCSNIAGAREGVRLLSLRARDL